MGESSSWFLNGPGRLPELAATAPIRLRQDLQQVMRGLMPEVAEPSPTTESQAAGSHVVDMDALSPPQELQLPPDPLRGGGGGDHAAAAAPELQFIITLCQKYLPLALILLLKLAFDHRVGILVVIGLLITFCHSNAIVKREVSKQNSRNLLTLLAVLVNLAFCICLVYLVLADTSLALALVLLSPYKTALSLWEVLWVVTVTDFVLKLITVMLKSLVVALPPRMLACQKKGKHYLFLESSSQLYRCLAPMQHWLYYFSDSYAGSSKVFGVILSATYLVSKWKEVTSKTQRWKKAVQGLLQSMNYGVEPTMEQLKSAGLICPICQDDYKTPTMLYCKHVFCEECVSMWFDRERTCPMCRAEIAHDPSWRDGTTSHLVQIM